jgi:ectoine hydroxylase-related dioxygenase (phytanoyl-CoA dioxygenase family)
VLLHGLQEAVDHGVEPGRVQKEGIMAEGAGELDETGMAAGGHQGLHRDFSARRPGDTVNALAFFDAYGPDNGATRLIPGSHRPATDRTAPDPGDEAQAMQLSGDAGDILVFDADLVHAGSRNHGGARRRSILIGYFAESRHADHLATAALRAVRMDSQERFSPD